MSRREAGRRLLWAEEPYQDVYPGDPGERALDLANRLAELRPGAPATVWYSDDLGNVVSVSSAIYC